MRTFFFLVGSLFLLCACEQTAATSTLENDEATVEAGEIASIIRNPVTAQTEELDTTLIAEMTFDNETHNFGMVDQGAIITHDFKFTNTGTVPLVISDVRSTCGCTVADWPREPIAPGGEGSIPVRFDTKNKSGIQSKPVTITANTLNAKTNLFLNGRVEE
ncbi:MAG: DUF1573 domain-containing protein [Bacteroidota bacterium]